MATSGAKTRKKSSSTQPSAGDETNAPLLPKEWIVAFKSLGYRLIGLLLLVLTLGLFVALITHSPEDKSLNLSITDTGAVSVMNLAGPIGAIVSDILLSTLGMTSYFILLPLFIWGQKILRMLWLPKFWMNLLALPFAMIIAPVAAANLEPLLLPYLAIPQDIAIGGFIGQILEPKLSGLNFLSTMPAWVIGATLTLLFIPVYAYSFAMNLSEWAGVRRAIWAFVTGIYLSLKAMLTAFIRGIVGTVEWIQEKRADRYDVYDDDDEDYEAIPPAPSKKESLVATPEDKVGILKRKRVAKKAKPKRGKREVQEAQTTLDFGDTKGFKLPPLTLLENPPADIGEHRLSEEALDENARMLENVLDDFGVQGAIVQVRPGPVVTLYELEPAPGVKAARVIGLSDDIARSMSAISARVAVVPGRNVIGIELPNQKREMVYLRELLASGEFESSRGSLPLVLGKDIGGSPVVTDMATMPHLLMAGRTGAGKSVGVNTFILSLLYRHTPETLRLIMVDPKMLELSVYEGIPHLLTPVVTEAKKAVVALKWAVREMEERYRNMSKLGVRNLAGYNKRVHEAKAKGEALTREVQTGFDRETGEPIYEEQEFDFEPLPQIVIIIDEMADLMIVAGKDVEATVQRLAQMARAAGIHVIIATQRPSVDVITGTIKANFPTRISFQVTSKIDSRTILGEQGAEQLLGKGDMLFMGGNGTMIRVHGAFVSDEEVEDVVKHLQRQGAPEYVAEVTEEPEEGFDSPFIPGPAGDGSDAANSLYDQAVAIVARDKRASTSYIQRRLKIGYNKAASLIEEMEEQGVISAPNHKGQREILLPDHENEF
ncbi:DNA translocase FtsK 4TM domain-containing protein [Temperatibacter marinus]|uniref:DNA translocase FtsK n=1 Tax=Temperatibacter marinus TaxID=1456591 RepID=A0AA52EH87_9PROT|nr:DNA translocase FtsK 4TM domain-containing protein [Temperatibacter marinus]WND03628.1 DNA translocase FtsK 4TM domain-containing protein [Temperatibacter marinus]